MLVQVIMSLSQVACGRTGKESWVLAKAWMKCEGLKGEGGRDGVVSNGGRKQPDGGLRKERGTGQDLETSCRVSGKGSRNKKVGEDWEQDDG
jgi:hypothetical protein